MSILEIFSRYGEAEFRRYEREKICEASRQKDCVIATDGRLNSQSMSLEKLYEERKPMYKFFRDAKNNRTPEEVARNIVMEFQAFMRANG